MSRLAHDLAEENRPLVVIIDRYSNLGMAEALRERMRQENASAQPRFVMFGRTGRRGFQPESSDTITISLDAMRMEAFLHAVAYAAGRASPEPEENPTGSACAEQLNAGVSPDGGELILIAEDNKTNQKVFAHQIAMLGHRCEIVENGRLALERWRDGRYALLLTDCHMPELDGYELTQAIRQEENPQHRTPIIAITADALKGTKERCVAAGMDDYLPKPIQLNELHKKLQAWLPPKAEPAAAPEVSSPGAALSGNHAVDPGALGAVLGVENKALFADFYLDFLRTGNESVSALSAAYETRQCQEVGALAHRLKSSARTVGAHALADCCLALERAGKSADWPAIDKNVAELPDRFAEVEKWIMTFSESLPKDNVIAPAAPGAAE
jgi:CheY-like chemotaxis protein/HPt (histidine-containing phosphotransfer) domain-containing protein